MITNKLIHQSALSILQSKGCSGVDVCLRGCKRKTGTRLLLFSTSSATCLAELLLRTSSSGIKTSLARIDLPIKWHWQLRSSLYLHDPGLAVIRTSLISAWKSVFCTRWVFLRWHRQNQMAVSGSSGEASPCRKLIHACEPALHSIMTSKSWGILCPVTVILLAADCGRICETHRMICVANYLSLWAVLVPRWLRDTHLSSMWWWWWPHLSYINARLTISVAYGELSNLPPKRNDHILMNQVADGSVNGSYTEGIRFYE